MAVCTGRTLAVTRGLLTGSSSSLFGAPLSHGQPRCHSTQHGRGTALSSSCAEHAVAPRVLTVQQRTGRSEGPLCVCPAGQAQDVQVHRASTLVQGCGAVAPGVTLDGTAPTKPQRGVLCGTRWATPGKGFASTEQKSRL